MEPTSRSTDGLSSSRGISEPAKGMEREDWEMGTPERWNGGIAALYLGRRGDDGAGCSARWRVTPAVWRTRSASGRRRTERRSLSPPP
jgi:hypothetical protein